MVKKDFSKRNWLGLVFSLVVISYVVLKLDLSEVLETFFSANKGVLLLAFGVYLLNYLFRTWRFRILLKLESTPFSKLFGLTSIYGMYLYLLPAKTGEVSYPVILKNRLGMALSHSAAALIVARFFDFFTLALLLPFVLIPFWNQIHPAIGWGALVFVGIIVISIVLTLSVVRRPEKWDTWIVPSPGRCGRLKASLRNLLAQLENIDRQGQYWILTLLTLVIWLCVQVNFYLIVLALGYPMTFFEIIVVSVIMVPMTLLPLQGFANLGTHEIGWTVAFSLFGYAPVTALSLAVSTHFVLVFFVLLLGGIGFSISSISEKRI